jgi:ATP-dependent DNA helicase RecG
MKLKQFSNIEDSNIDYKEKVELKKPKSWLKSVSAFANGDGGLIIFGVKDDDKKIVGLNEPQHDADKISELINSRIEPIPRFKLSEINNENKEIIKLDIGDGPKTPYYYFFDGVKEAYIRSGNESIIASKNSLDELILKGNNCTFDELPTKYEKNDVSFTILNALLKQETGKGLDAAKDYLSLGLYLKDGFLTYGGLLLSDNNPLPQSKVVCTRWNGNTKGSINKDALDDKEFTGSIISQLQNAEQFVKNYSKLSWGIVGLKRVEQTDYPLEAIREAIVNAIIHRNYQLLGSEVHIDIYNNRLEITSPGGMFDNTFIQDLNIYKVSSMRRNRIISDVFARLNLMERRGSGLVRMIEAYKNFKSKPTFYSTNLMFNVTFPNMLSNDNLEEEIENKTSLIDKFRVNMYKSLPKLNEKTYQNILQIFKTFNFDTDFNYENIMLILNIKKTRASNIIKMLLNHNLIKSTKLGYYKFKK